LAAAKRRHFIQSFDTSVSLSGLPRDRSTMLEVHPHDHYCARAARAQQPGRQSLQVKRA